MTLPRLARLVLMFWVSLSRWPWEPESLSRSLPARSIKFSTPIGRCWPVSINPIPPPASPRSITCTGTLCVTTVYNSMYRCSSALCVHCGQSTSAWRRCDFWRSAHCTWWPQRSFSEAFFRSLCTCRVEASMFVRTGSVINEDNLNSSPWHQGDPHCTHWPLSLWWLQPRSSLLHQLHSCCCFHWPSLSRAWLHLCHCQAGHG